MEESFYHQNADIALAKLLEYAEALEETTNLEVEYDSGVMTLIMPNKRQYVINKHAPSRQIWVSSPYTGASYFEWNGHDWVLKRSENVSKFYDFITAEIKSKLN